MPRSSPTSNTVTMLGWVSWPGGLPLPVEALADLDRLLRVEVRVDPDRLERHPAVDDGVAHEVHVAHPAAAEVPLDLVASEARARGAGPLGRAEAAGLAVAAPRRRAARGRRRRGRARNGSTDRSLAVGASSVGISFVRGGHGRWPAGRPAVTRWSRPCGPGSGTCRPAPSGPRTGCRKRRPGSGAPSLGHVLEPGIDVEDLLVDQEGLVAHGPGSRSRGPGGGRRASCPR